MRSRSQLALLVLLASQFRGCGVSEDIVFSSISLPVNKGPWHVNESVGVLSIPFRLSAPPANTVSVRYELIAQSAQSICPERDFEAQSATLTWAPGQQEATLSILITDDSLAETDETFTIRFGQLGGATFEGSTELTVVIDDNDRTQLIDAAKDFGVLPSLPTDSAPALQKALDAAAASGRGVVVVAPGDYELSSVSLTVGTTLYGPGATFHRPALSPVDLVSVRLNYAGASDSLPALLQGVSLDGRRSEQGEFRKGAFETSHLVQLRGEQGGRARATFEGLTLKAGPSDGISVSDNADATVCATEGYDLWREFVRAEGGNIRLRAAHLNASASEGTSGIWVGSHPTGYASSGMVDAELENVSLGTGDLELQLDAGSTFSARRLTMAQAPIRILAPNSRVRISDSVLMVGIPSSDRNYFHVPHDFEVRDSTVFLSERTDEEPITLEADRDLVFAAVSFSLMPGTASVPGMHRLLFNNCRFQLAPDVEPTDVVHVVRAEAGGQVVVQNSSFGPGIAGWFATPCVGCELVP